MLRSRPSAAFLMGRRRHSASNAKCRRQSIAIQASVESLEERSVLASVTGAVPNFDAAHEFGTNLAAIQIQYDSLPGAASDASHYLLQRAGSDGVVTSVDPAIAVTVSVNGNTALLTFAAQTVQDDYRITVLGSVTGTSNLPLVGGDWVRDFHLTDRATSLDASFGVQGQANVDLGGTDSASSLAIQPDGKVVVGGSTSVNGNFALARYLPNGTLDSSFGSAGTQTTDLGSSFDSIYSIALQGNKIVAVGQTQSISNGYDFGVARYLASGQLDTTFGGDGIVTTGFLATTEDVAQAVAVTPDGHKIVVVGTSGTSNLEYAIARYNDDGSLDTTFANDGYVRAGWDTGNDFGQAVAIQPDGKILVAGYGLNSANGTNDFAISRYLPDGSLDSSFGTNGKVMTPVSVGSDEAAAITIQADGKILLAGTSYPTAGMGEFAVVRYLANGSLDTTFGNSGIVRRGYDGSTSYSLIGRSVAVQDEMILVTGYKQPNSGPPEIAMARWSLDGTLDLSLAASGLKFASFIDNRVSYGYAMGIRPTGQIVVAGQTHDGGSYNLGVAQLATELRLESITPSEVDGAIPAGTATLTLHFNQEMPASALLPTFELRRPGTDRIFHTADDTLVSVIGTTRGSTIELTALDTAVGLELKEDLYRLTIPGSLASQTGSLPQSDIVRDLVVDKRRSQLDTTFDVDGRAIIDFGGTDSANGVAIQRDSKVVLAGGSAGNFILARYNTNGTLDATFDGDGRVTLDLGSSGDNAYTLAIQADQKIVAAGQYQTASGTYDFGLARLNTNGSLDTSFGGDGIVTTGFLTNTEDAISAMAIQPDGKIVAVGNTVTSNQDVALVRYLPDGSLDPTFGVAGKLTDAWGTGDDFAYAMALQPDGKFVVVGESFNPASGTIDLAVARYLPSGALDTSFGTGGRVITTVGTGVDRARAIAIQPDGRIVVAGESQQGSSASHFTAVRYLANGTLDTSFGGDGIATRTVDGFNEAVIRGVAIQPDGRIVGVGYRVNSTNQTDIALVRWHANGTLDEYFREGDAISHTFNQPPATTPAYGYATALASDGSIYAVGQIHTGGGYDTLLMHVVTDAPTHVTAGSFPLTIDESSAGTGQILSVAGSNDLFDGLNRLDINGVPFAPALSATLSANGQTFSSATMLQSGVNVKRQITVPNSGTTSFVVTIDEFANPGPTDQPIQVRLSGNFAPNAGTTVFNTSSGDTLVSSADEWVGIDDNIPNGGSPALVQLIHGPEGINPSSVIFQGDSLVWDYNLTISSGQTIRLATISILGATPTVAVDAKNLLIADGFLTPITTTVTEPTLSSLNNFNSPLDIQLTNQVPSISEQPASRRIADVELLNAHFGSGTLSLSSSDHFELLKVQPDNPLDYHYTLNLKPNVPLDFEGSTTSYSVTILADDPAVGPTPDESILVTVGITNANDAPILDSIGNRFAYEQNLLTFNAIASDEDVPANTLTYSLANAPSGATIDSVTGVFSWTPTAAQGPAAYSFQVLVSDGTVMDQETITITVLDTNAGADDRFADNIAVARDYGITSQQAPHPLIEHLIDLDPITSPLRDADPEVSFAFGAARTVPDTIFHQTTIVGDWTGDGYDEIGTTGYSNLGLQWQLDVDRDSVVDDVFYYGMLGNIPVVGNFDGNSVSDFGTVVEDSNTNTLMWFIHSQTMPYLEDTTVSPNVSYQFRFGQIGDTPVIGDFNGDGSDDIGVVRKNPNGNLDWYFHYGTAGTWPTSLGSTSLAVDGDPYAYGAWQTQKPVVGNWDGDSDTDIGVVTVGDGSTASFWSLDTDRTGATDYFIPFGSQHDQYLVGHFNRAPQVEYDGDLATPGSLDDHTSHTIEWTVSDFDNNVDSITATLACAGATLQTSSLAIGSFTVPAGQTGTCELTVEVTEHLLPASIFTRTLTAITDDDVDPPILSGIGDEDQYDDATNVVSWGTFDPSGVSSFSAQLDRFDGTNWISFATSTDTGGSFSLDGALPGLYRLSLQSTDADTDGGNLADRATNTVVTQFQLRDDDVLPPTVTIQNGVDQTEDDDNTISWTTTDDSTPVDTTVNTYREVANSWSLLSTNTTTNSSGIVDLNSDLPGRYRIEITATDGDVDDARTSDRSTQSQSVEFTIADLNHAPTAIQLTSNTVPENTSTNSAIGTFSTIDPDGDTTFTYALVTGTGDTDNSAFVIDGNQLKIAASLNFETQSIYSVRVRSTDQGGLYVEESFTIQVTDLNEPPVLGVVGDHQVNEESELTFVATAVDPDLPAVPLTFSLIDAPDGATIDGSSGLFSWTPTEAQGPGDYTFDVVVSDGTLSDSETITIKVKDVNQQPNAVDDVFTILEDTMLAPPEANVLLNDSDPDGDPLTVSLVSGPAHGDIVFNSDGTFVYTPHANYHGTDTITYRVINHSSFDPADLPGLVLHFDGSDVGNGSNPADGQPVESWASKGLLALNAQNLDTQRQPIYIANAINGHGAVDFGLNGNDLLQTMVSPDLDFSQATVLMVSTTGGFPVGTTGRLAIAQPNSYNNEVLFYGDSVYYHSSAGSFVLLDHQTTVPIDQFYIQTATFGDSPYDITNVVNGISSQVSTVTSGSPVPYQAVSRQATIGWRNTEHPAENYAGKMAEVLVFNRKLDATELEQVGQYLEQKYALETAYQADDYATVTINVTPVNDAPELVAIGPQSVDEGSTLSFTVQASDIDTPPAALTLSATGLPTGASFDPQTGVFNWSPTSVQGPSSYVVEFSVSDGQFTDTESVTITVNPINDAPVANDDTLTLDEDTTATVDILTNDTDVDNVLLPANLTILTQPAHGTLVDNQDGTYTYTPEANYFGTDAFTYKINDGELDSNIATVAITVNSVNNAPIAVDDAYVTDEDVPLVVPVPGVLGNDTDTESLSGGYTATVLANSPLAYWKLGENGGVDRSGNGNHVYPALLDPSDWTLPGAIVNDADTATLFDGQDRNNYSDRYEGPAHLVGAANYTIEAWVRPSAIQAGTIFQEIGRPSNHEWLVHLSITADGHLYFNTRWVSETPTSSSVLHVNDWNHVAVSVGTIEGVYGARLYVNGELEDEVTGLDWTVAYPWNTYAAIPYSAVGVFSQYFEGQGNRFFNQFLGGIDEVVLYDHPLSANDIQNHYAARLQLAAILVSGPQHGQLTLSQDGSFVYTPDANYFGPDSFVYRAFDGVAYSDETTVNITVNPVNDAPVLTNLDDQSADVDTVLSFTAEANDLDNLPSELTYSLVNAPAGATIDPVSGVFYWTPSLAQAGTDYPITVHVQDPQGAFDEQVVNIAVTDPILEPTLFVAGDMVLEGERLVQTLSDLTIAFPGAMATSGPGSVLDTDNWQIIKNGQVLADAIQAITFGLNPSTNHHEAVIHLTYPLTGGQITVTAMGSLQDGLGAPLGVAHTRNFRVNQPVPLGQEFRVNTTTTGQQTFAEVGVDASGNSVVVWFGSQSGDYEIYGQRYAADGTPLGGEFQISGSSSADVNPQVSMNDEGDFVVTWQGISDHFDVFARAYESDGTPKTGPFLVNTGFTSYIQDIPFVDIAADGRFVVVYRDFQRDTNGMGIFGQRYDPSANPISGQFQVNEYSTGNQSDPRVAMTHDGEFIAVWGSDQQDGSGHGIYAQRFRADATRVGAELQINTTSLGEQYEGRVAVDSDGDALIVWVSTDVAQTDQDLFGQFVSRSGDMVGPEFPVNTYTQGSQYLARIAADHDGDFIVTWNSDGQDGSGHGIYAQRFNLAGVPQGRETRVNTTTVGQQGGPTHNWPTVEMDADGDYWVAWGGNGPGDSDGVFAQRFGEDLVPPTVSSIIADATLLAANELITQGPSQLKVRFSEPMSSDGAWRVTNPAHWSLTRDGQTFSSAISSITYQESDAQKLYEVTLSLTSALTLGAYELTLSDQVEDLSSLRLDGDADQLEGGTFLHAFRVAPGITFAPPYAVGTPYQHLAGIAVGDFNGDLIPDLVSGSHDFGVVEVLLGKGDGTYFDPLVIPNIQTPREMAADDFNEDGFDDLAIANGPQNQVTILLSLGDGTFAPAPTLVVGQWPDSVLARDFNADGHLDLAVAHDSSSNIYLLLGDGTGSFTPSADSPIAAPPKTWRIDAGDFDGDGNLDLAATGQSNDTIGVLFGKGNGEFHDGDAGENVMLSYGIGDYPYALRVADFNSDGLSDLVVGSHNDHLVHLFAGQSNRTLLPLMPAFSAGARTTEATVGDFNGDGTIDVLISLATQQLRLLAGNGQGQFFDQGVVATSVSSSEVAATFADASDVNGDGALDLIAVEANTVTAGHITVLLNQAEKATPHLTLSAPTSAAAGDVVTVTVTAVDAFGATLTNFAGTIHFASSDLQAILPSDYTFTAADQGVKTFNVTLNSQGPRTVVATLVGSEGLFGAKLVDVVDGQQPPVAHAGGPYAIDEGQSLTLDGSLSFDPDNDPLSYAWDLDGDDIFDDATGVSPTLTWAQLSAIGLDGQPTAYGVRVRVDDGHGNLVTSDPAVLSIANLAPTASGSGPTVAVTYQELTFHAAFSDPNPADVLSVGWDFGDGNVLAIGGASPQAFAPTHRYANPGTYTVTLSVYDDDNAFVTIPISTVTVTTTLLDGTEMLIGGTGANDVFTVDPSSTTGLITVKRNNVTLGTFAPPTAFRFFGGDGVDELIVNGNSVANTFDLYPSEIALNGVSYLDDTIESREINALGQNDSITYHGGSATVNGGANTDTLIAANGTDNVWNVTAQNTGDLNGLVSFIGIERLIGDQFADSFLMGNGAGISTTIDGQGGQDLLDYSAFTTPVTINRQSGVSTKAGITSSIETLIGGQATDTIIGSNVATNWTIPTDNSGFTDNGLTFSSFESLTGGTQPDTFFITGAATLGGNLNGGGGVDTLQYLTGDTLVADLETRTITRVGGTFASLTNIQFGWSDADQVFGDDSATTWRLTGPSAVLVNSINFSFVEHIHGGSGVDTVYGPNQINSWDLTGPDVGTSMTVEWTGMENLTGGSQADTFFVYAVGTLSGKLQGGGGSDLVNYQFYGSAVNVNLATKVATGLAEFLSVATFQGTDQIDTFVGANNNSLWRFTTTGGTVDGTNFNGFENWQGGSAIDTLQGQDIDSTWIIDDANGGQLYGIRFSQMETLNGGDGIDRFDIRSSGSISGTVNGGLGADLLDFGSDTSAVTVDLETRTATHVALWTSIIEFRGTTQNDSLIGANDANLWDLLGGSSGSVDSTIFQSFESLTGGTATDTFRSTQSMPFTGTIDGGAGLDKLDYSAYTLPVVANLATGIATDLGIVSSVENLTGGSADDILIGNSASNVLLGRDGNDILIGGAGSDTLNGDNGRDLVIGGSGTDTVRGNNSEDVLIAGHIIYALENESSPNFVALEKLRAEWARTDLAYAVRISHLNGTVAGGLNESYFINNTTVVDEGAVDSLFGDGSLDWFVAGLEDSVNSTSGETVTRF